MAVEPQHLFPVIVPARPGIPNRLARVVYSQYCREFGNDQSFERLRERGGFGVHEVALLMSRRIAYLESVLTQHSIPYETDPK